MVQERKDQLEKSLGEVEKKYAQVCIDHILHCAPRNRKLIDVYKALFFFC